MIVKNKIVSFNELKIIRKKNKNKKIVLCHGVFDLIHHGHLKHLRSSKESGDILVVTLTPDIYVNKGPKNPFYNENIRAEMMASIEYVDYVIINKFPKAIEAIHSLKPNIYSKGPDYKNKTKDYTKGIYDEENAVKSVGGILKNTHDDTLSSSNLLNDFFHKWSKDQKLIIERVKKKYSIEQIFKIIDDLQKIKVLVVGESIIDTYIFCTPENISSKSPSISSKFEWEENYLGGSLAVAKHLDSIGTKVTLLSPIGNEEYIKKDIDNLKTQSNIKFYPKKNVDDIITPRKIRYISHITKQRIFELTDVDAQKIYNSKLNSFNNDLIRLSKINDLILILDFGHGLWEHNRKLNSENIKIFKSLNVQVNSNNLGFNIFKKYKNYDFIVLDERELRLGMQDRFSSIEDLIYFTFKNVIKKPFVTTLGRKGSIYIDKYGDLINCPIFFNKPQDTTGAGDALFVIASLLAYAKQTLLIPFIGNLFAGLKTQIIGNKKPVSLLDLKRTIETILK